MSENTDELLRDWSPAKDQSAWEDHWRRTPAWREATFENLERSFAGSFVEVAVRRGRRTYEIESKPMAEIIADCLRTAGAIVERPRPCTIVSW
jgi:hypothetical protein